MARRNMRSKDDQVAAGRRFIADKEEEVVDRRKHVVPYFIERCPTA